VIRGALDPSQAAGDGGLVDAQLCTAPGKLPFSFTAAMMR